MEKGNKLTLTLTLKEAANFEAVEHRTKEMSDSSQAEVNRLNSSAPRHSQTQYNRFQNPRSRNNTSNPSKPPYQSQNGSSRSGQCMRCGKDKSHEICPAMGKKCHKCKKDNHFQYMCKSTVNSVTEDPDSTAPTHDTSPDDEHYAFSLRSPCIHMCQLQKANIVVGDVEVRVIIDSGADCNIIDQALWNDLKRKGIKVNKSVKGGPSVYPYSSRKPLPVTGQFWADLKSSSGKQVSNAKFLVVEPIAEPILGIGSSVQLDLVRFANSTVINQPLRERFPHTFCGEVGKAEGEIKLSIDDSVTPVVQPFRRVPFSLREKLETHLNELIESDIIEKVSGPVTWASPVVIVPKPDSSIRLCVDMRQANNAIIRHNFPVPTIDELLLDMNGSTVFSKIDLKSGFHQFVLEESSRDITTFTTHVGLYRYKRLMFGISSAPEIYQSMVARIIHGIPGAVNLADDIVVHGKTREEHDNRLVLALQALEQSGMTLNEKKCCFSANEIKFLGHRLTDKGVDPGQDKVKAITEASIPQTVGEMKSFLGLTGYCSKFIPDYSSKTEPLRRLTVGLKPPQLIYLNTEEREAFKNLKESLANARTLAYFDIEADTILYTDAGPVGVGCVLVQKQKGEHKIICYASKALTDVERRYCQTEKEALAIVWACERLHHYLFGVKFTLMTDHKALEVIYGNKKKKTSARIERWVLRLQSYDFDIKYVKGGDNIADPLSRLLQVQGSACLTRSDVSSVEDAELYVRHAALGAVGDLEAITAAEIERASGSDGELSVVRRAIESENFSELSRPYKPIRDELCILGRIVMRGNRIVVPVALRERMLRLGHEGHLGIVGTKRNLRTRVWWPGIDLDVERLVKQCHSCQITGKPLDRDPIRVTEMPNGPWEDLAADLLGPLPNGDSILVVVDYYSRYYEIRFLTSTVAEKVIDSLQSIFDTHGLPVSVKTDNGPQFIAHEFKQYLQSSGIHHHLVIPRWPEANGEVERQNRSINKRIRIAYSEGKNYRAELRTFLTAYRNTPHSITGKSPAELLFGRKLRIKIPQIRDVYEDSETRDRDTEIKRSMVDVRNGKLTEHPLKVGDLVLVKRDNPGKVDTPFHPNPYTVKEVSGPMIVVESEQGRIMRRNVTFLRPYLLPDISVTDREEVQVEPTVSEVEEVHAEHTESNDSTAELMDEVDAPVTSMREKRQVREPLKWPYVRYQ